MTLKAEHGVLKIPIIFHESLLHSLRSQRSMVWCLWMVNNWSHFPQKNGTNRTLPWTNYEVHVLVGGWWTILAVSTGRVYTTDRKLNNGNVEQILWQSHYCSKLVHFDLWGVLKDRAHKSNPCLLKQLKQKCQLYMSSTTDGGLKWVAVTWGKQWMYVLLSMQDQHLV